MCGHGKCIRAWAVEGKNKEGAICVHDCFLNYNGDILNLVGKYNGWFFSVEMAYLSWGWGDRDRSWKCKKKKDNILIEILGLEQR